MNVVDPNQNSWEIHDVTAVVIKWSISPGVVPVNGLMGTQHRADTTNVWIMSKLTTTTRTMAGQWRPWHTPRPAPPAWWAGPGCRPSCLPYQAHVASWRLTGGILSLVTISRRHHASHSLYPCLGKWALSHYSLSLSLSLSLSYSLTVWRLHYKYPQIVTLKIVSEVKRLQQLQRSHVKSLHDNLTWVQT